MERKEMIYNTLIQLFQWMDASEVEDLDKLLGDDVALILKCEKKRPTKANTIDAIKNVLFSKIRLGIAEEKCPTDGFLSIQSSLIQDKWLRTTQLLKFIKKWKQKGYFDPVCTDFYMRDIRQALEKKDKERLLNIKICLIETILRQCIISEEMRIDLQHSFGQFDGAQICEYCGNIMWDGYSWNGTTYCDDSCVIEGECIDRKQFNKELEDAEDPDCPCYWTSWF